MTIAIASSEVVPAQFDEDRLIVEALTRRGIEAEIVSWDAGGGAAGISRGTASARQ